MAARRYQPFYCEENIWWLLEDPCLPAGKTEVAMLANPGGLCMLFNQRAAIRPGEPVAWDYHVVLAVYAEAGVEVWDLDCALGAPLSAASWFAAAFPEVGSWPAPLVPRFRLLQADGYRRELCSDARVWSLHRAATPLGAHRPRRLESERSARSRAGQAGGRTRSDRPLATLARSRLSPLGGPDGRAKSLRTHVTRGHVIGGAHMRSAERVSNG